MAVYFLAGVGSTAQTLSYEGIGVLALVACVTGILVHRPQRPAYLWWLVAGICFHLAGDAVLLVYDLQATAAPFPSIADFVYLGGYASVVVSMILLVRRRERPVSSDVLDALIVLVGSALLFWFTLVEPFARGAGSNVISKLVAAAYPSADVLLVVAVSQLMLSAGSRSTSFRLIAVGALFMLGTDFVYGMESLRGLYAPGGWLDAGWMISLVLFGVAVLHPSISALDTKTPVHDTRLTWQRLALLGVALLITPIVFAVYSGPADSVDLVIIVAAGTLTTLLVVARMALLFREHTRAIVALRDAAAQREVEQALRSANVRFEAAAQALECAIYEWNPETEEVLWTEGLTSVFQHPVERRGSPNSWFMEQVHPDDRAELTDFAAVVEGGLERAEASYRFRAGDGTYRYVWDRWIAIKDADGAVSRIVGGLVDATDRHELELLLHQSQKMEAVGQLAGGIAHDFNNLLLAISGNAELLQDSPTLGPQDQEDVREIVKASGRAAELTSQLLTFSRPDLHELGSVDLNSTVAGVETLLKRVLGENIEIATSLEPHAPAVLGTASGIEQIVVNLAVNARDAMPAGGHLRISTQLEPGCAHVRLVVEDTGEGMDEATAARVFEPFFTTKGVGKGTGLGLATVYGIVDQVGGTIALASQPGEGTRFDVLLPVSESRPAVASPVVLAAGGGSEQILLVEDEAPVRAVVTKMLAARGYAVLSTGDPIEALELLARGKFLPDLIVSDLVMPGMSGVAFAERVESLHPGLRFLFISGYSGHSALEDDSRLERVQVIQKPFAAGELTRAVREALDAGSVASHAVV
jgi:signal transduction histidine kinase/ActR/RegA family two-component response regulator